MGSLFAGGWNNTLMGSRALAIGAAFAAVADDPSAIYYNPAGLAFQERRMKLSIGGFYVQPTHEYTMPTGSVAYSRENVSFPQLFLSYSHSERITVGLGAYIPYAGGGINWPREEIGFAFKSHLGVVALTPSFAYRVNEKLSVGVNLFFYRALLEVNSGSGSYGSIESEENGSALSAGVGVLYRASSRWSFGLNVRGPARMKLEGKTSMPVAVPQVGEINLKVDSETRFNLPWDIECGVAFQVNNRLLLSASAQYTMWSTLERVEKTLKNIPQTGDIRESEVLDFQNILIWRAGMEYMIPGGLFLRAGFGLDHSASPTETLTFTNIDVDKWTLLGGIGYQAGSVQIDCVFVRANGKEREKSVTAFGMPLTERYNLNATILGMSVTFVF